MDQRQEATARTRAQILDAARALLGAPEGISAFTIDAVARQAGVARMTVYYQFGSKVGLLEALSDDLAARGQMERLATAFQTPDALHALNRYIATFARFWETDRLTMRRLRALAALDPDFAAVIRARDERRRTGVRVLVERLRAQQGGDVAGALDEQVNLLYTLIGFECFDTLAGPDRTLEDVAPLVQRLARAALTQPGDPHERAEDIV
jgi:AcrR family transcriptional regulator